MVGPHRKPARLAHYAKREHLVVKTISLKKQSPKGPLSETATKQIYSECA